MIPSENEQALIYMIVDTTETMKIDIEHAIKNVKWKLFI